VSAGQRRGPFPWEEHGYPEREFDEALEFAVLERRSARKSGDVARLEAARKLVREVLEGKPEVIEEVVGRALREEGHE